MESDESQYHAAPQTMGRIAHKTVDEKKTTNGRVIIVLIENSLKNPILYY